MLVIGLTGLIGSGKSTVANLFAAQGAQIIDTDLIAHQLTAANGSAMPALAAQFGPAAVTNDGALNRDYIRQLVFSDRAQLLSLEAILHPLIFNQVTDSLQNNTPGCYAVLVVPLLFKSPRYLALTRRNIFVDCAYPRLVERLAARSNLTAAAVDAILATQLSPAEQLALADDVIDNNSDYAALESQVASLHQRYLLLR